MGLASSTQLLKRFIIVKGILIWMSIDDVLLDILTLWMIRGLISKSCFCEVGSNKHIDPYNDDLGA